MAGRDPELAKAYADLAKAEEHAAALEAQLQAIESSLDAFLAAHGDVDGQTQGSNQEDATSEESTRDLATVDASVTTVTNDGAKGHGQVTEGTQKS